MIVAEKRDPTLDRELDLAWLNLKIQGTRFLQASDFMAGSGHGAGLGQVTNMTDAVMRELPLDTIRPKEQDVRGCASPVFVG